MITVKEMHSECISDLTIPVGKEFGLYASSSDGTLSHWDFRYIPNRSFKHQAKPLKSESTRVSSHQEDLLTSAVMADASTVAVGTSGGAVHFFSTQFLGDCSDRLPLPFQDTSVNAMVSTPHGIFAAHDEGITLCGVKPYKPLVSMAKGQVVECLAFGERGDGSVVVGYCPLKDAVMSWDLTDDVGGESDAESVAEDDFFAGMD